MKKLFKISLVVILAVFAFACSQSTVEPVRNKPTTSVVETSIIDDLQETAINAVNTVKATTAAVSCECVQYIRNRFPALVSYRGNAKDWHSNLIKAGYKVTSTPVAGNIIVFQPSFGGIDKTYGHIAVVSSYSYKYDTKTKVGTRTLQHRGSNTGGSETECSCNNVKTSSAVTYTDSKVGSIAYYSK